MQNVRSLSTLSAFLHSTPTRLCQEHSPRTFSFKQSPKHLQPPTGGSIELGALTAQWAGALHGYIRSIQSFPRLIG